MSRPSDAEERSATPEKNAAVVRRFYKGMNAHDLSAASLFAEDVVHHNLLPGGLPGREALLQARLVGRPGRRPAGPA